MKKWFEKLSKTGKIGVLAGATMTVVLVFVALFFIFRNKEEAYRNIRVNEVVGTVYVNREGMDGLTVSANMNLLSGDEIITEKDARLTLRLDDDKYIILDEASKLILRAAGTAEDSKTTLELAYGAVFSDIKNKLSEKSNYKVVTPSSTMSVRGTQVEVVHRPLYDEKNEQYGIDIRTLLYEGTVSVALENGEEYTLNAGELLEMKQNADGTYEIDGEIQTIEVKDLTAYTVEYLKESLSGSAKELTPEQEEVRKALLQMVLAYMEDETKAEEEVPTPEPTEVPTPEPTEAPTPEPTATPTPEPTATPVPTPEPTATPVPTPEPTATPVPTPEPTATPVPTPEPTATPTPEPTKAPAPTPTVTPKPTATPTPTVTPTPTATPTPTKAPDVSFEVTPGFIWPAPERPVHTHTWDSGEVVSESTCKTNGQKKYTCTGCGDVRYETLPLGDHTWDDGNVNQNSTCVTPGKITYTCTVCPAQEQRELPLDTVNGHLKDAGYTKTEPTCVAVGIKAYNCTHCDQEMETEEIPAKGEAGHKMEYSTDSSVATEERDGHKIFRCVNEGCAYFTDELLHYPSGVWELAEQTANGWEPVPEYVCSTEAPADNLYMVQFCLACMNEQKKEAALKEPAIDWFIPEEEILQDGQTVTTYHFPGDEVLHYCREIEDTNGPEVTTVTWGMAAQKCRYCDAIINLQKHTLAQTPEGGWICTTCDAVPERVENDNGGDWLPNREWCRAYGHLYSATTDTFELGCTGNYWLYECLSCHEFKREVITADNIPEGYTDEERQRLLTPAAHNFTDWSLQYTPRDMEATTTVNVFVGMLVDGLTTDALSDAVLIGKCSYEDPYTHQSCTYEESFTALTDNQISTFFSYNEAENTYTFRGLGQ